MKSSRGWIPVLSLTAAALGAANWYVLCLGSPNTLESQAVIAVVQAADQPKRNVPEEPAPEPAEKTPPFAWEPVESEDYKAYIENLRKLSFPEELIRELIISDVNALYSGREAALAIEQVPYDAPLAQRRRPPTLEDVENQRRLLELRIEKQEVLQELLGIRVPREILRTPNSRNYEAREYALSLLPPEKQEAVQRIQERVFLDDDLAQVQHGGRNVEAFRKINEKRDQELLQILTPEEFDQYMMHTTPAGTEMARRIIGMEPTEEELAAIWRLTEKQWKEQGGVYDWWRAERVPANQIARADADLAAGLLEALGEERYQDYQMAVDGTGQQLRNFAARYDLPRESVVRAFKIQAEIDAKSSVQYSRRRSRNEIDVDVKRLAGLREQLTSILGADYAEKWEQSRRLNYDLQPDLP